MRRSVVLLAIALAACQTAETPRPAATTAAAMPVIERPRAILLKDDSLKAAIGDRLAALGPAFRAISVEAWSGRVLLMGAVIKPEHRRKAEQLAREAGASVVLNELVLAEERAFDLFRPDAARAAMVRRHLGLGDGAAIRVINGVAFLLGAAPPDQAAALKADASEVEGVKWVVAHFQPN